MTEEDSGAAEGTSVAEEAEEDEVTSAEEATVVAEEDKDIEKTMKFQVLFKILYN